MDQAVSEDPPVAILIEETLIDIEDLAPLKAPDLEAESSSTESSSSPQSPDIMAFVEVPP